jgi:hypothetical protein
VPPPPSMDVDKVFDVESTTSYMDEFSASSVGFCFTGWGYEVC